MELLVEILLEEYLGRSQLRVETTAKQTLVFGSETWTLERKGIKT
jgi:hypothetical protein